MSYYQRQAVVHSDGTKIFQTEDDRRSECEVAALVERRWGCTLKPFGALATVDYYVQKHQRMVGVAELKTRSHELKRYPTTFLNVRKWMSLNDASFGLHVPAVLIVRFTDGCFWIPITAIDASRHIVGGCMRIVKSHTDIEPQIEIPIGQLRRLTPKTDP